MNFFEPLIYINIVVSGGAQLLPDILDRHIAARVQRGDGHVTHGRPLDARLHPRLHFLVGRVGPRQLSTGTRRRNTRCRRRRRQRTVHPGIHGDATQICVPPSHRQPDQDHGSGHVQLGPGHSGVQGAFKGLLSPD